MGAKRDRAAIEAQMAELQAELDTAADDDDAEIWVKREGTEVKLVGGDKRGFMDKFFGDLFGDGEETPGEEGEGGGGEEGQGEEGGAAGGQGGAGGAGRRSYWGSGKRNA